MGETLLDFHQSFAAAGFKRIEQQRLGEVYLKGLVSNLERKSVEPIALHYLGTHKVRSMQMFFSDYKWDDEAILDEYQRQTSDLLAEPGCMLTVDSSEFPKKGEESVGVAPQYCGHLGKVANCQSGIFAGYASTKGYALLDRQLYLPKEWLSPGYAQRRQKCRVPEDLSYESKTRIALKLVQRVRNTRRFPVKWVGCDAYFGADSEFLEEIDALGLTYFADIRSNTQVWLEWPQVGIPPYKGRGPRPKKAKPLTPSRAIAAIAGDTQLHWQKVKLAEGAKGPVFADVARLRVVTSRDSMPNREQWLYLRRLENGKVKYALSNAAPNVTLEEMNRAATMRWSIEQCFEECKQNLGMDHYEMRSWLG